MRVGAVPPPPHPPEGGKKATVAPGPQSGAANLFIAGLCSKALSCSLASEIPVRLFAIGAAWDCL